MNYKIRTLALLLLAVAAGSSAQAQKRAQAGAAYTINSVAAATGTGITYQWYRDGQPIAGAISVNYTVPASQAYGTNVEFKRGVMSSSCPGEVMFSNSTTVTFYKLMVGNTVWAEANVAAANTFATNQSTYTQFYQWNSLTPRIATGNFSFTGTFTYDPAWTVNPCPTGWRLPTQAEFTALVNTGSTWIAANALGYGNTGAGRLYGFNRANAYVGTGAAELDQTMGFIFLPAGGVRDATSSSYPGVHNQGTEGYYWTTAAVTNDLWGAYGFYFSSSNTGTATSNSVTTSLRDKYNALNIRCVMR